MFLMIFAYLREGGGETHMMKEEQLQNLKLENGSFVGSPEYIISSVSPVKGKTNISVNPKS